MEIKSKHKQKQKHKLTVPPRPPRRMLLNWCTAAASAMIANFPPNPLYAKPPATIPKTHCSLTENKKKTHSQTPNTTTTSHHHISLDKFNHCFPAMSTGSRDLPQKFFFWLKQTNNPYMQPTEQQSQLHRVVLIMSNKTKYPNHHLVTALVTCSVCKLDLSMWILHV